MFGIRHASIQTSFSYLISEKDYIQGWEKTREISKNPWEWEKREKLSFFEINV
jgi:hypothetical protein